MTKAQVERLKYLPRLLKAIHQRCLDCSAYNVNELKNCVIPSCPLYLYKKGTIEASSRKRIREKGRVIEKNRVVEPGSEAEKEEESG